MKGINIKADKDRTLRFNINTIIEFKKNRGIDIVNALQSISEKNVDFELIRYLYFLGLKWEDNKLTEDKAGQIMDTIIENQGAEAMITYVANAIGESLGLGDIVDDSKN